MAERAIVPSDVLGSKELEGCLLSEIVSSTERKKRMQRQVSSDQRKRGLTLHLCFDNEDDIHRIDDRANADRFIEREIRLVQTTAS